MKTSNFLYGLSIIALLVYAFIVCITIFVIKAGWDAMWILGPLGLLTAWVMIIFILEGKRLQKASNKPIERKERYISPNKSKS